MGGECAAGWGDGATGEEGPLADALFKIATEFQNLWHQHSQSLRLSVLETVSEDDDWEPVKGFVTKYGSDLFTVPFLGLSNMRGILARGVAAWLDHETETNEGGVKRPKLVIDWDAGAVDKPRTVRSRKARGLEPTGMNSSITARAASGFMARASVHRSSNRSLVAPTANDGKAPSSTSP